ncbi:MAG: poly-gamma-glutamate hydrolase family protein [Bacillota bacterium]
MADRYTNFRELQTYEKEGLDYRIRTSHRWHRVLIIAPHGGKIELYTSQIAQWIAGKDFAWYVFEGIKDGDNQGLHITSHNFDEPTVFDALSEAEQVLTIHGQRNIIDEFVIVGGLDLKLCTELSCSLRRADFSVIDGGEGYRGERRTNICNQGRNGKGVQLEISYGLRKKVFEDANYRKRFVETIRSVITRNIREVNVLMRK